MVAREATRLRRRLPFPALVTLLGARDYLTANGGLNLLWTVPLRAVLATVFFTMVGQLAGGADGRRYAFVGAVAYVSTMAVLVKVADVVVQDRWQGCIYRLRLGRTPTLAVMICRGVVYLLEGVVAATCAALLAGPVLVGSTLTLQVAAALPIIAVGTTSCLCLGLFLAASAVGRRAELLVGNAAALVVLVASGAVVPLPDGGAAPVLAGLVPLHHSLAAVRAMLDSEPVAAHLLAEATVSGGWLALAWLLLMAQTARARRTGHDDFG